MISRSLVARYEELKQEAPGCVLLMQVGAFMKVLNVDARTVSGVTGLKLQMAGDVDAPVVTGGFPKTGLDTYVGKLVRAGRRSGGSSSTQLWSQLRATRSRNSFSSFSSQPRC